MCKFNVSDLVVRITDMLKFNTEIFVQSKFLRRPVKKYQIFLSSSVKLQERVMCSPAILSSFLFLTSLYYM